jgi:hypothetical protein
VIQLQLDPAVIEWTGNVGKAEAEDWTEDEKRGFCEGMYAHGNDLLAIQKEHVPSKTIRRVVRAALSLSLSSESCLSGLALGRG